MNIMHTQIYFETKHLGKHQDLYVQSDTLLLVDRYLKTLEIWLLKYT